MGIVAKQTIKGSIWSYLGVGIGFITTTYLYTEYLTSEVVGLLALLVSISTLTASIASLGFTGVTQRLFPHFRSNAEHHNGFLFIAFIVQTLGFLIFLALFLLFREQIIAVNIEKSSLFAEYLNLLIPLTLFSLGFAFLDIYNMLLYDTVLGAFLYEFLQRFLVLTSVLLYAFRIVTLDVFVILFTIAVSAKTVIMFSALLIRGEINLRPKFSFLSKKLKKEMLNVALFSIFGGFGSMIVFNIDKIVINQLLDLKNTGVYTIAFFFGTLITIPSRSLLKISGTLISDSWKVNDIKNVKDIYYKSCINQFIIGGFLFLGLWANIDNIMMILGPEYAQSKWVIFFIGLGNLIDMLTGANGLVLNYSKYYRVSFIFLAILIGLVLVLLYSLIPLWGIVGAAIAITIALLINNIMRYLFLLWKYKMQPFNWSFLIILLFNVSLFFVMKLIPQLPIFLDLFIRGGFITLSTLFLLLLFPISEDIWNLKKIIQIKLGLKSNSGNQNQ